MAKHALLFLSILGVSQMAQAGYDSIYDYRSPVYYNSASASVAFKDKTIAGIEGDNVNLKGFELGFAPSPDYDSFYGNIGKYTNNSGDKDNESTALSIGVQRNLMYLDRWYVLGKAALGYQQATVQDKSYKADGATPVDFKVKYDSAILPLSIELGRPITRNVDAFLGIGGEIGYIVRSSNVCNGTDTDTETLCKAATDKSSDLDKGKITTGLGASAGLKLNF